MSTPSMRRGDLVSVGRSHAHQNLVKNTEFTLGYETAILLYLSLCVMFISKDSAKSGGASGSGGTDQPANCQLHPRRHTLHFITFIMWPTVFMRLITYLKFRNANYIGMQNSIFFLNAFYNVAYGIWTILNILSIT